MLKRALGVGPEVEVRVKADLMPDARFVAPTESELMTGLENHRLDLVALRQGYQSQEQTLVAACLDQFPRINLGFSRDRDNTNVRSIGLAVSIDIPLFDRNQGVIATEKANRQKLRDEYISRVFDARADIAQALADIAALNSQIADAQAALPGLQKLVDVYHQAVDRGNADLFKLQQQLADNRVALEIASGRYFPDEHKPAAQPPATLPSVTSAFGPAPRGGLENPEVSKPNE
jgi:outer membrane protein TolC